MIILLRTVYLVIAVILTVGCTAQKMVKTSSNSKPNINSKSSLPITNQKSQIQPAAYRINQYLPLLKGKKVAVFANQTSVIGNTHLVDTLRKLGVDIKVIFGPEHGFRGTADAGEKVESGVDRATGIPVISLYGKKRKPTKEDLKGADLLLFDIQDVGVRFYTYISSLQDYMEAAIEHNLPLVVLDRPNPNGFYVDGPVLEPAYKSFIGMQSVPIVYGMTIGEYAKMILEEGWLSEKSMEEYNKKVLAAIYPPGAVHFSLKVIPCENYTHESLYELPVKPSPNLPEIQSVYWYPSTCFFEGTVLSEGRGTDRPFQIFGHPSLPKNLFRFTPTSREGAKEPKLKGVVCYGWNLSGTTGTVLQQIDHKLQLKWLLQAYQLFPDKESFFLKTNTGSTNDYFFNKLAGNATLMKQIKEGVSESEIRKSWEPALSKFKQIRKKYLLYQDFNEK
ncbi:DUF1343 domain-containing protein [Chitinophagaceae bacterium LB-8]|uniref:DUF1343 domain-containing protein n=1 Tax=Paraflavisolibacter caeni TaxID=2982496 RepID=A0A9X3B8D2_9BACT|nr:DUF1343 domain-containing protein [Paraflavisolibacter caeni]MCU7550580.1 DUF1343 domain-containing protein [Paraflavisolibacter caeni]